jgi:hypothetical protein
MGLFHKLKSGASNFFKKAGGTADNLFRKASNTVGDAANIVGKEIVRDGKVVGGGLNQAGNFLEKNSATLATVGAGLAVASGVGAELAPAILAAGASGQALGQRARQAGSSVKQFSQNANSTLQTKSNALQNTINNARQDVATRTSNAVNTMDNLQPSNNLAQIHADLATA